MLRNEILEAIKRGQNSSIKFDGPDAVAKLSHRIDELEKIQRMMIETNKMVRRNDSAGLRKYGYSEDDVQRFMKGNFMGEKGFPKRVIKNNRGVIGRLKKRLALLEQNE